MTKLQGREVATSKRNTMGNKFESFKACKKDSATEAKGKV